MKIIRMSQFKQVVEDFCLILWEVPYVSISYLIHTFFLRYNQILYFCQGIIKSYIFIFWRLSVLPLNFCESFFFSYLFVFLNFAFWRSTRNWFRCYLLCESASCRPRAGNWGQTLAPADTTLPSSPPPSRGQSASPNLGYGSAGVASSTARRSVCWCVTTRSAARGGGGRRGGLRSGRWGQSRRSLMRWHHVEISRRGASCNGAHASAEV